MAPFEELKELWQSQPEPPAEPDAAARASGLTAAFRCYRRRHNYFNVFRLSAVLLQIVSWVVLWAQIKEFRTPLIVCGLALLLIAESVVLFSDWRNQLGIARLNFTEPSLEFVRNTIQCLYQQRDLAPLQYWLLVAPLVGGVNLLILTMDPYFTLWQRIAYHLIACAVPFAAIGLGLKFRRKGWRCVSLPLVERLRAIERALAESEI